MYFRLVLVIKNGLIWDVVFYIDLYLFRDGKRCHNLEAGLIKVYNLRNSQNFSVVRPV